MSIDYRPPTFGDTYGQPPDYADSTGVYDADEDGRSVLDMNASRSFFGSSIFGSIQLNSRTDLRKSLRIIQ